MQTLTIFILIFSNWTGSGYLPRQRAALCADLQANAGSHSIRVDISHSGIVLTPVSCTFVAASTQTVQVPAAWVVQ